MGESNNINLYQEAKIKSNEGLFDEAAKLFLEVADNFRILQEKAWAARAYGRVAWNKMEIEQFQEAERFLETSTELDFDQACLNYLWAFYICSRNNNGPVARKYLLSSVSMIYHNLNFSYMELKKQKRLLKDNPEALIWQIIKHFCKQKIRKAKDINSDWIKSDDARCKMLLVHLIANKKIGIDFVNSLKSKLELANLVRLAKEFDSIKSEEFQKEMMANISDGSEIVEKINRILLNLLEEKIKPNIIYSIISILICIVLIYVIVNYQIGGSQFVSILGPSIAVISINIKIWWG